MMECIVYHEDLKHDNFEDSVNFCCPDLGIWNRGLGSLKASHEVWRIT